MFNTTEIIKMTLKTPDAVKVAEVTFPTDEQWTRRAAKIKIVQKDLGRGKSRDVGANAEQYNAELFDAITKNEVRFDQWEKSTLIERLSRCEVTDSYEENGIFSVQMNVPGGEVTHQLKRPSERQKKEYYNSAYNTTNARHGISELSINLNAAEKLYDALTTQYDGYADGTPVPVIHKSAAINELMLAMREDEYEGDIQGF